MCKYKIIFDFFFFALTGELKSSWCLFDEKVFLVIIYGISISIYPYTTILPKYNVGYKSYRVQSQRGSTIFIKKKKEFYLFALLDKDL